MDIVDGPRLLDLFACAGAGGVGYERAGFSVYAVDNVAQPNNPHPFCLSDALEVLEHLIEGKAIRFNHRGGRVELLGLSDFAAAHASPPCQLYSAMSECRPGLASKYPALIEPTRALLIASGLPWVIENVERAPLLNPVWLCGQMFGLDLYRHRGFESNIKLVAPPHPAHVTPASKAGHWTPGTVMSVAGHVSPMWKAREIMGGIDWMTRDELGEAIPPAYTTYVGTQLRLHLEHGQQDA